MRRLLILELNEMVANNRFFRQLKMSFFPVSYTHLDVYKRQVDVSDPSRDIGQSGGSSRLGDGLAFATRTRLP